MRTKLLILIILFLSSTIFSRNPILFPKRNNKVCINKTCTIKWDANYFFSVNNIVKIIIYKGNSKILTVNSTQNDGSWDWKVPANLQPGNNYRVFIKGFREVTDPEYYSGYFNIIKCGLQLARNSRGRPQTKRNYSSANVQKPNTSQLTSIDICESFQQQPFKIELKKFTMKAADPYDRNSRAVVDLLIVNRGNRCVRQLRWRMFNSKGEFLDEGIIKPGDYGKSKWFLRGGEKINVIFTYSGPHIWNALDSLPPSECIAPFKICNKVLLHVLPEYGNGYKSNTMQAIARWAFEKDE